MTQPLKRVREIVKKSNERLMQFEHEPSYWNGMMVYEAGDIEDYHDWLATTLTQLEQQILTQQVEIWNEVLKDLDARMEHEDYVSCPTCDETRYHIDTIKAKLQAQIKELDV